MERTRSVSRKAAQVKMRTPPPRSRPKNGRGKGDRLNGKTKSNGNGKPKSAAVSSMTQKEKLTRERAQVMEELTRLRAELQEAPDPTGDEADSNVYEREKTLGLVAAFELRLEKIDSALRAAEKGEYGICQRCGKPIDPARLKIFPESRYCVADQTELERLAKRKLV